MDLANTNFITASGVDLDSVLVKRSYLVRKELYGWGNNYFYQISSLLSRINITTPQLTLPLPTSSLLLYDISANSAEAITSVGINWAWGRLGDYPIRYTSPGYDFLSVGRFITIGIKDGKMYYGNNAPIPTGLTNYVNPWSKVVVGESHYAAIDTSGSVFTWGLNTSGQLGLGDNIPRSSPVQVGSSSWTSISIGKQGSITAAIRNDGGLFMWGLNTNGELGQSDLIDRSSPVQIGTSSWSVVSVGNNNVVAIKSDGTLWSWGKNSQGVNGINNSGILSGSRSSPVQVGTSKWLSVSTSGDNHTIAIRMDSTLWGWGDNTNGQLGQGDLIHRSSPTQIGTSNLWTSVKCAPLVSFAAKDVDY